MSKLHSQFVDAYDNARNAGLMIQPASVMALQEVFPGAVVTLARNGATGLWEAQVQSKMGLDLRGTGNSSIGAAETIFDEDVNLVNARKSRKSAWERLEEDDFEG